MAKRTAKKAKKELKDYLQLIEDGYVLDVKGQWIHLNEKVRKERSFIKHLEAGEVLVSGNWIPITKALKLSDSEKSLPIASVEEFDETAHLSTDIPSEITNQPVHDETQTGFALHSADSEPDFPPETIMISHEEIDEINNRKLSVTQDNAVHKLDHQAAADQSLETLETIAIPLNSISDSTISTNDVTLNTDEVTLNTDLVFKITDNNGSGTWEADQKKRKGILITLLILAFLIGGAVLALKMYSPVLIR